MQCREMHIPNTPSSRTCKEAVSVGNSFMTLTMSSKASSPSTSEGSRPVSPHGVGNDLETTEGEQAGSAVSGSDPPTTMTMEQRRAKLVQLRRKMVSESFSLTWTSLTWCLFIQHSSSLANRASVVEEASKAKLNARETARLERQRKLAETLRLKADAEERGEDVERKKNWEWTIEENEEWEKKQARKARRADYEFHGAALSPADCLCSQGLFRALLQTMHTQHVGGTRKTST